MHRPGAEPRAGSGLPRVLERWLIQRYGQSLFGHMAAIAALRAAALLLRKHPKVAVEMVGAGLCGAGEVGLEALRHGGTGDDSSARPGDEPPIQPAPPEPQQTAPVQRKRLKRRDLRRLRKYLDDAARRKKHSTH